MGRYDLHLTEEEFWGITPREFGALRGRLNDANEWLDYRAALVCSVIANVFRSKTTRLFKPDDFMPKRGTREQTPEQILATVELLNAAFGGDVVEE